MNNTQKEKYLVCCALPYANGPQHLGHLAGAYLPGDVYARFRKMQGHDVLFVCGTDEYGAAITFRAKQEGLSPKEIVDKYHTIIHNGLKMAGIEFDIFSRTTHPCHTRRVQDFFLRIKDNGYLEEKSEKRLFCSSCKQFLPDRYVVGECPRCHSKGARGDQCEKCGEWYEPEELINPSCQLCSSDGVILKETTHWYLCLNKLEDKLRNWLKSKENIWRKNVLGYAYQPLKNGMEPRAITRDLEWGVPVPLESAEKKVLYVWFDAPIGYISATEDWAIRKGDPDAWRDYWEDKNTHLVHFIGKDNIIFHTIVWPGILMADGRYVLPDLVAGNEFLNLEGDKFSTSRNYALWIEDVLKVVDRDALRFYLTAISPEINDSNFSWSDFQTKVNTELADTIGNLFNRTLKLLHKNHGGVIRKSSKANKEITNKVQEHVNNYVSHMTGGFSKLALQEVVNLARAVNLFVQEKAPWALVRDNKESAHSVLTDVFLALRAIAIMLYPVCPTIAQDLWEQLGYDDEIKRVPFSLANEFEVKEHRIGDDIHPIVNKITDEFVKEQRLLLSQVSA